MNKKLIAIALITLTLIIGGAAIYVGMRLSDGTTSPTDVEAYESNGILYTYSCPAGNVVAENGTVCLYVPNYAGYFISKHWCNSSTWLYDGCQNTSPTSASVHYMADGSINQQGLYSPSSAACECSAGGPNGTGNCADVKYSSVSCNINLFRQAPFVTKICLDRVPGDRSQTFCGLQQIDLSTGNCFLSGLMSGVPECQALPPTETPSLTPSEVPSITPSVSNTLTPSVSISPTVAPSITPSIRPSFTPSVAPSITPSIAPSITPSIAPSITPSIAPSITPSIAPSITPSIIPSVSPSRTLTPTVSITGSQLPTVTPSASTTPLPQTAIVTDEIDRMIIGFILLMIGLGLYKSGLYISLGNLLWNNGGISVWSGLNQGSSAVDRTIGQAWLGLNEFDSKMEGSVLNFFEKLKLFPKLIADFIVIISLNIVHIFLSILLITVRLIKKLGRILLSPFNRKLIEKVEKQSFEESLIKRSSKKRS